MFRSLRCASLILVFLYFLTKAETKNKYSQEVNQPKDSYMTEENPFRMQKVNLLWQKAKKRLADQKVKVLYSDLKVQDKEELTLKKLKSDGQDKDGIKEAQLRRRLNDIMKKYGLNDPWTKPSDNEASDGMPTDKESHHINKVLFKDKKLNKLWTKAEKSGLTEIELKTLKEEFEHHQEKIEQYYQLMDKVNELPGGKKDEFENSIDLLDGEAKKKPNSPHTHQRLKEKHRELKDGYDKLITKIGTEKREFEEHAVQVLWELAEKGDFTPGELDSLRDELHHYEKRIRKLRHFQGELELVGERHGNAKWEDMDSDGEKPLHRKVKELEYKVSKIHNELENRILQRHSEL